MEKEKCTPLIILISRDWSMGLGAHRGGSSTKASELEAKPELRLGIQLACFHATTLHSQRHGHWSTWRPWWRRKSGPEPGPSLPTLLGNCPQAAHFPMRGEGNPPRSPHPSWRYWELLLPIPTKSFGPWQSWPRSCWGRAGVFVTDLGPLRVLIHHSHPSLLVRYFLCHSLPCGIQGLGKVKKITVTPALIFIMPSRICSLTYFLICVGERESCFAYLRCFLIMQTLFSYFGMAYFTVPTPQHNLGSLFFC